jgi:hypothetical protein
VVYTGIIRVCRVQWKTPRLVMAQRSIVGTVGKRKNYAYKYKYLNFYPDSDSESDSVFSITRLLRTKPSRERQKPATYSSENKQNMNVCIQNKSLDPNIKHVLSLHKRSEDIVDPNVPRTSDILARCRSQKEPGKNGAHSPNWATKPRWAGENKTCTTIFCAHRRMKVTKLNRYIKIKVLILI